MKKWRRTIGIAVLCVLVVVLVLPVCLATDHWLSFEGAVKGEEVGQRWNIGELDKIDKTKVVITELYGNGRLDVYFGELARPHFVKASFISPGEYTFIAPEDGQYYLHMECYPHTEGAIVHYKGYADIYTGKAYVVPS